MYFINARLSRYCQGVPLVVKPKSERSDEKMTVRLRLFRFEY
jgi:hypothetical protein